VCYLVCVRVHGVRIRCVRESLCVCVCVCVCGRMGVFGSTRKWSASVCVCVYVCMVPECMGRERESEKRNFPLPLSLPPFLNLTFCLLCTCTQNALKFVHTLTNAGAHILFHKFVSHTYKCRRVCKHIYKYSLRSA